MVTLVKKNEAVQLPLFKNGVTLDWYKITFPGNVTNKLAATPAGDRSPVVAALEAVQARVSVEIVGRLQNVGTELVIGVAAIGGEYPPDNYDGVAGTESMADYLKTLVKAAGVHQGVDLANATVATFAL